jgi:hypothetical protein
LPGRRGYLRVQVSPFACAAPSTLEYRAVCRLAKKGTPPWGGDSACASRTWMRRRASLAAIPGMSADHAAPAWRDRGTLAGPLGRRFPGSEAVWARRGGRSGFSCAVPAAAWLISASGRLRDLHKSRPSSSSLAARKASRRRRRKVAVTAAAPAERSLSRPMPGLAGRRAVIGSPPVRPAEQQSPNKFRMRRLGSASGKYRSRKLERGT